MRGFRQFSSHLTKCHACHGICTLSPVVTQPWTSPDSAICENTRHDKSQVLRLPRKMTMDTSEVLRLLKLQRVFRKRRKSIAPATRYKTRLNVTKCHACHAIWNLQKWPLLQNLTQARPYGDRTNGCERLRMVADGCGRLRTVGNVERTHPQLPDPAEWNGNPCYAFGKNATHLNSAKVTLGVAPSGTCKWMLAASRKVFSGSNLSRCKSDR